MRPRRARRAARRSDLRSASRPTAAASASHRKAAFVVGVEVTAVGLVRRLQQTVVQAVFTDDRDGEEAA